MSLFLIAGSIASTLCSCAATDSSAVVGYIDEHPITMEEFNYFLSQQKSSVCQSYSQLYGITSFDSAFWNNEYGDSTPLDSARASAKEACLEAYATQMLAEKTTSAEFLSFSQLKEKVKPILASKKSNFTTANITEPLQAYCISATLEAALFLFFRISNSRACQARELRKEKTRFCMMHSTAKRKPQNEKAD